MAACEAKYASLAKALLGDIVNTSEPSSERAADILLALQKESSRTPVTVSILKQTNIGRALAKAMKACQRHKKAAPTEAEDDWDQIVATAGTLLSRLKENAKKNAVVTKKNATNGDNPGRGRGKAAGRSLEKNRSKMDGIVQPEEAKRQSARKRDASAPKQIKSDQNAEGVKSAQHEGKVKEAFSNKKRKFAEEAPAPESSTNENADGMESTKPSKSRDTGDLQDSFFPCCNTPTRHSSSCNSSNSNNTGSPSTTPRTVPPNDPRYRVCQRVYARDDATGLLYPALVRKVIWGPKSNQVTLGFCSVLMDGQTKGGTLEEEPIAAEGGGAEEDDEDARHWDPKRNGHHYFVHYLGWNVKWDRWVEEQFLYEGSASTEALKKMLTAEYNKFKPKRGQKMSPAEISKWMKRIVEIEAEHKILINEASKQCADSNHLSKKTDVEVTKVVSSEIAKENVGDNSVTEASTQRSKSMGKELSNNHCITEASTPASIKRTDSDKEAKPIRKLNQDFGVGHFTGKITEESIETSTGKMDHNKKAKPRKLNQESLQKQAQLLHLSLQMKRKRSLCDRLTLPFNLQKILVEEWEVIAQCDMVHNLPSQVTVRDALNSYLENKLAPLREKQDKEGSSDGKEAGVDTRGSDEVAMLPSNGKKRPKRPVLGKEWVNMVEGIALFFDQALPVHLLLDEERSQYRALRRQILAQQRNLSASAASVTGNVSGAATKVIASVENNFPLASDQQPPPIQSTTACAASTVTASESSVSSSDLKSPLPKLLPERMSEIYGCEHLLRLFLRLPSVTADAPTMSEIHSRRIFSKLGDLVRYLQKHQSQLFCASYRRPLAGENRSGGKRKKGSAIATKSKNETKKDGKKKDCNEQEEKLDKEKIDKKKVHTQRDDSETNRSKASSTTLHPKSSTTSNRQRSQNHNLL